MRKRRHYKLKNYHIRQLGAAALELCYVAAGRIEAFLLPGTHVWDVAAGKLIVEEARGKITDIEGKKYDISKRSMLASNNILHKKILDYF